MCRRDVCLYKFNALATEGKYGLKERRKESDYQEETRQGMREEM